MKSKFLKLAAAVAVVLAVGCGGGDGKKDNPTGGGGGTPGKLIVTGIPAEYNGKYAGVTARSAADGSSAFIGFESGTGTEVSYSTILGGQVSLNTFNSDYSPFTGSGSFHVTLHIFEQQQVAPIAQRIFTRLSITNGGATVNWTSGSDVSN
jgi:hypothetical protein